MPDFSDYVDEAGITRLRATGGSGAASGPLKSETVPLTNAQILAMNTGPPPYHPVTVVPAASGVQYAVIGAAWSSRIVDVYTDNSSLVVASTAGIDAADYILAQLFLEVDTPPRYKPIALNAWDLTSDLVVGAAEITGGGNAANTATVTVYYFSVPVA